MKSKQVGLVITLTSLFLIFSLSLDYSQYLESKPEIPDCNLVYNSDLKSSAISEKIHIIGNIGWSDAKNAGICTGSGIYSDPYVIENLEIDAENNGSCIVIEDSDVHFKIQYCTLLNSGHSSFESGVHLKNVTNGKLVFINTASNLYGICLSNSFYVTVSNNSVINNQYGIYLFTSNYATISDNNVSENLNGICLYQSDNNTISENNVKNNYNLGFYLHYSDKNTLSRNIASHNNDNGILLRYSDMNIISVNNANHNNYYGIRIMSSKYNIFSNNTANYNNNGISVHDSRNNTFLGNFANYNSNRGFYLDQSNRNILSNNKATKNDFGICLYSGDNNILTDNNVSYNNEDGINLEYSYYNTLSGIKATNNNYGFDIQYSLWNDLSKNDASYNNIHGIYLYQGYGNTFSDNNATYNNYGIYLEGGSSDSLLNNKVEFNQYEGIYLDQSYRINISRNKINNNMNGIYVYYGGSNSFLGNNMSYNNAHGVVLYHSNTNAILGNTLKNNSHYGIHFSCSYDNTYGTPISYTYNNILERNYIINNKVGIYIENTIYKITIIEFIDDESNGNQISNNIFLGNNQNIKIDTHFIKHHLESLALFIITLLSITTCVIVFYSITVEFIRKKRYARGDEKYRTSVNGIYAITIESLGVLVFILSTLFLIPIIYFFPFLFILTCFSIGGLIYSIKGLKNDAKKSLAGLGLGFGILLSILGSFWIIYNLIIIIFVVGSYYWSS